MDINGLREILFEVISSFFWNATVIWSDQIMTQPPIPYVTLKMMDINRGAFPVCDKNDSVSYLCSTTMDVNLHTNGIALPSKNNTTINYQNTATQDMMDFAKYIESDGVTDKLSESGIDISLMPPIRNLSELQNDTMYRYRSMAEFAITFPSEVIGRYAVGSMTQVPNSSGGGTEEIAKAEVGYFEEVEIKDEGGVD